MSGASKQGSEASRPSTVERAFQLAQSGACRTVNEIAIRLKQERHDVVDAHLAGQSIRRELRRLCANAHSDVSPDA